MINAEKLLNWPFEEVVQQYTERDTMLYALGIGLGADPVDPQQLRFVYERNLQAFPTMSVVLCHPGPWIGHPDTGVNRKMVVHGEQSVTMHRALPPSGTVRGRTRVTRVVDKGQGQGALVFTERNITNDASGELIATLKSTSFCRADGGFSDQPGAIGRPPAVPTRQPDLIEELPTLAQSALIYRLNADYNPLHADPDLASSAGYQRPILHGLCTFGLAAHALLKRVCGYHVAQLASFGARFTAPVYPGESISVEMWVDGSVVSFRAWVRSRNAMVLDNGRATINIQH